MTTIAKLRGLLAAATPGKWHVEGSEVMGPHSPEWGMEPDCLASCLMVKYLDAPNFPVVEAPDAALIVAAHNALPALLDLAEAAQGLMDSADCAWTHTRLSDALAALEALS